MPLVKAGLTVLPIPDAAGHAPPATLTITTLTSTLVSDAFNRANSTTAVGAPDVGPTPTALTGTWGISSNQLYLATSGGSFNQIVWNAGAADVQVDLDLKTGGGGLVLRVVDAANHYLVNFAGIYKKVAGAFTKIASTSQTGSGWTPGDHLTVSCIGNVITVKINQVQVAQATDSTYPTQTSHGVDGESASQIWDNLSIVSAPTPVTLYTDRNAGTAIGSTATTVDGLCLTTNNVVIADVEGVVRFYAMPGNYKAVKNVNGVTTTFTLPVAPDPVELASKF